MNNPLPPQTLMVFAATDATFIEMSFPEGSVPQALKKYGKTFHRLTPEYWVWFYRKYQLVEDATARRQCPEHVFVEILNRISALYNRAIALYGWDTLKESERATDVKTWEKSLQTAGTEPEPCPNSMPAGNKSAVPVPNDTAGQACISF